jgi:hypothetical protein
MSMPATDEEARRNLHRPQTLDEVRKAAQRMANEGLSDYSIAAAFSVDVNSIRRLLGECAGGDCG